MRFTLKCKIRVTFHIDVHIQRESLVWNSPKHDFGCLCHLQDSQWLFRVLFSTRVLMWNCNKILNIYLYLNHVIIGEQIFSFLFFFYCIKEKKNHGNYPVTLKLLWWYIIILLGKLFPPQSLYAFGFKIYPYFGVRPVLHTAGLDIPDQSPALTGCLRSRSVVALGAPGHPSSSWSHFQGGKTASAVSCYQCLGNGRFFSELIIDVLRIHLLCLPSIVRKNLICYLHGSRMPESNQR